MLDFVDIYCGHYSVETISKFGKAFLGWTMSGIHPSCESLQITLYDAMTSQYIQRIHWFICCSFHIVFSLPKAQFARRLPSNWLDYMTNQTNGAHSHHPWGLSFPRAASLSCCPVFCCPSPHITTLWSSFWMFSTSCCWNRVRERNIMELAVKLGS